MTKIKKFDAPELNEIESIQFEPDVLYVFTLGGCGEFGANFTAYYIGGELTLVDCGILFSDSSKLGTDCLIPKLDEILNHLGGIKYFVFTHGHEDHIGAITYFFDKWPCPIYGSKWTLELIKQKYKSDDISKHFNEFLPYASNSIGKLNIKFLPTNHSIPMAGCLYIKAPNASVFHTGDFKLDFDNPYETPMDLPKIQSLISEPVDLLISDSTNATKSGFCPSEGTTIEPLARHIREAPKKVVLTTFASNLWRVMTIINICKSQNRKLCVSGGGFHKTITIAGRLGLIDDTPDLFIEERDLRNYKDTEICILASGSQGEQRSALSRILLGEHPRIKLSEDDTVIFSSRTIPGNEKILAYFKSICANKNIRMISGETHPDIHVSGHGYQKDIEALLDILNPRYHIPVHGTFIQLRANQRNSKEKYANTQIVATENGCIIQLHNHKLKEIGKIEVDKLFIDSFNRLTLTKETLRERLRVGESGAAIVSGILRDSKLRPFEIQYIGLPFPEDFNFQRFEDNLKERLEDSIQSLNTQFRADIETISESIRIQVRHELKSLFIKKPIIFVKLFDES